MKIVLSPAKSLDFETPLPTNRYSENNFLPEAAQLNKVLKELRPEDLSKLMSISEKLADLNWKRNQEWQLPFTPENARPAVFAFKGDAYQGLDAYSIPEKDLDNLQNKLRILSGQYGILKPLDLIQPYRLEMGTKLTVGVHRNLYQFWGERLTDYLNNEMEDGEVLVNLASQEYFKVLQPKKLKARILTPVFKDYKNGKLKMISFYAKRARGMMVRYIIDEHIANPEEIKNFNREGYLFDEGLSTEKEWVFTR